MQATVSCPCLHSLQKPAVHGALVSACIRRVWLVTGRPSRHSRADVQGRRLNALLTMGHAWKELAAQQQKGMQQQYVLGPYLSGSDVVA